MKKLFVITLLVFASLFSLVAAASSAPTSSEVSTSIEVDNSDFLTEIEELESVIVDLKVENAVLKNSNENLEKIITHMNDVNANSKNELVLLQADNLDLKVNNAVLANTNSFLNTTLSELLIERGNLQEEVDKLEKEIYKNSTLEEELKSTTQELNNLKESITKRVQITNSCWEYCYDHTAREGIIWFDDLSIVETITVAFKDDMFNDISNSVMSDCYIYKDTLTVFVEASAPICEFEIFYKDGRSETITHKIIMG